ncbi:Bacteriophage Mu, Gp36 [uncultured Caudovirales phage]|uniref:Bacteriophage Mu, Gp36 n=1 Tax=uncultured Caudovirales phage TaxID=2100421 RepID=A0A6J5PEV6_9CAUD|nr:Bacteriophage Mu, Gp36 [uncultured Caudovirales phage]CAB4176681.1 Bacteriophage Mu, Gp36 [uncultured Caudovirales phage]CAB4183444.1 Bacteriophage Mu, Gp36 [uncultured Caudovirales phage]CAB4197637.1 Bacteriophage Mu, Gp36 [uncultured Caudovirales phage]CAB4212972.1 Bacteriophage Mu, Gp36 [uncultured Caudovirales phage]
MGRYTDWDHLVGKYQDAAKIADASQANTYFIHQAEDEVDAWMASRYTVPFSSNVSHAVKDICTDLAYYKMTWRQKDSEKLYAYIEKRVNAFVNGTMVLTDASGNVFGGGDAPWATSDNYSATFGVDNVLNWQVSSNAQYDAEYSRD